MRSAPEGFELAKTCTEAIRLLAGPIYCEVVSLDHDIIFKQIDRRVGFSEETFATVARYIAIMPKDRLPKIVYIHTANPRGACDMEEILRDIVPTMRVGDSANFDMSVPSFYKEDLIREEKLREGIE